MFFTEKWTVPFKWYSLEDICKKISSGGTPSANNKDYYGGNIPWLRTQEINWKNINSTGVHITAQGLKNSSAKWIAKNCVIVAMYGATAGKVAINEIPLTTNQACCNLEVDNEIAQYRFVFYWLSKEYKKIKALGQGSQSNINAKILRAYRIPIPEIKFQNRIVSILDRFDTLCNDLSSGLPAEIEARKKQYEYYRDKLLSFEELKQ
jgi:type I restriction enzyme S subunit